MGASAGLWPSCFRLLRLRSRVSRQAPECPGPLRLAVLLEPIGRHLSLVQDREVKPLMWQEIDVPDPEQSPLPDQAVQSLPECASPSDPEAPRGQFRHHPVLDGSSVQDRGRGQNLYDGIKKLFLRREVPRPPPPLRPFRLP